MIQAGLIKPEKEFLASCFAPERQESPPSATAEQIKTRGTIEEIDKTLSALTHLREQMEALRLEDRSTFYSLIEAGLPCSRFASLATLETNLEEWKSLLEEEDMLP